MQDAYNYLVKTLNKTRYPSPVFTDPLYRLAKGTDAGFYRLVPRVVVQVNGEQEVITVLNICREAGIPVTFKAGGTSLCGQTITDSVLVETGPGFAGWSVSENAGTATFQPGMTGGYANAILAKYRRQIGPSPASIASAKIGGIIANNASGASYGIATNSYNTLRGLRLVFSDSTILDTRDPESCSRFRADHPTLMEGIRQLSEQVNSNPALRDKIRHKYELKNTTGYGVNALVDFSDPLDIIAHLMVGSEGTLGFISEATFETFESHPCKAAALVFFPGIREACSAILPLRSCQVSAAELMDRNALRAVQDNPGIPAIIRELDQAAVALLIDTSAPDAATLEIQVEEIRKSIAGIRTLYPVDFIREAVTYNSIWKVRKGLFTAAAATRPRGTSCLIEDVAFRAGELGDALTAIRELIQQYGYEGSVMWGHLLDGNIHFVIMPDFRQTREVEKYRKFMDELVHLTVHKYDGSLKAEHGTGRNMAPFVKEEWGTGIYGVMKQIKQLLDPSGILNPGVILNDDPLVHIKNLKPIPVVSDTIDKCIECGFCENDCPSRNLTLTPRQRIVVYREMNRLSVAQDKSVYAAILERDFDYHGDATCATDGLCAIACPVDINTGTLIKELRFDGHSRFANRVAGMIGSNMHLVTAGMRITLNLVSGVHKLLGTGFMQSVSSWLHKASGAGIPMWNRYMPGGADVSALRDRSPKSDLKVVYFPTCINRSMGKSTDYAFEEKAVVAKTIQLLQKAGYEVIIPPGVNRLCCGMAFDSKGFVAEGRRKAAELEAALLAASENGKIPVYCDMSPCLFRMKEILSSGLQLYEPVEFILRFLVSRLTFTRVPRKIAVHSTCSNTKMGLGPELVRLAQLCAEEVIVPDEIGCCGWAGDRGFTRPELNASALRLLKGKLPSGLQEGYSTSRTCEIGLTLHSDISYKSIVYLVDEATAPMFGSGSA
ncbi:MAG: FAD-binding oxidoreductase [Bacteroidales bacterium]|nr:FAD-binding oxidoreductase [Bacteroidales bacterium]